MRIGHAARLNVAGRRAFLTTDTLVLGLHDDGVRIEPSLLEGLQQKHAGYPRVLGNMPTLAWAVRTTYAERANRNALSHWSGSEWVVDNRLQRLQDQDVLSAVAWSKGRLLMLVGNELEGQPSFVQVGGANSGLPQLPVAVRDEFLCLHGLQPGALSALPSGEVYLASRDCSTQTADGKPTHGVLLQRWAPGETRPQVTLLPGLFGAEVASGEIRSFLAISSTDVFVAGTRQPRSEITPEPASAYLAHFDGQSWRIFSAPPIERIDDLQRAPDGRLWALGDGQLWHTAVHVAENATWQRAVLPELAKEAGDNSASSFWVQDNEQVWATLGGENFVYLVRTKRGSAPLSAPSDRQLERLSRAVDRAASCESPTLVLLTLPRNAPPNADMPRVRAALRGYTELDGHAQLVEVPFLTRRYLGARGDNESLYAIQEIVADAHIPGITPELRCLSDPPTRTLNVDFSPIPGQSLKTSRRSRERAKPFIDIRNP